jgi:hypothetical protein
MAENDLKPWRKDMWCIPQVDADYVARMEDVLDLYAEPRDSKRPVVCFDKSLVQLIGEVRRPIRAKPGRIERYDCEYRCNGTANLFVFLDVHRSWRKVKVTERRAAEDFAACMRELTDVHYPKAERIRVVLDNLSTHSAGALYQSFPAAEARRVLRRLEFHYVPKHASWLNMVEIEIGVLASQCLDRRIESYPRLVAETAAWEKRRNAQHARIKWMFTTEKARAKMGRAYPKPRGQASTQRVKTPVQRYLVQSPGAVVAAVYYRACPPKGRNCPPATRGCTRSSATASASSPARTAIEWGSRPGNDLTYRFPADCQGAGQPALALLHRRRRRPGL